MFSDPHVVSALNSLKNHGVPFEEAVQLLCKVYGKEFEDARVLVEIQEEIKLAKENSKKDYSRAIEAEKRLEKIQNDDFMLKFIKKYGG